MHIRLGSRRRAYKASTDGNFDDNIYFDEEPFGSTPTSSSSSSFLPIKLQNGPSPVHHVESALTTNRTIDTTLDSNLAPSPIKTAKATISTDSSSPTEKKGRFKFFKRKSKKESSKKKAKNKSKEADDKNKGMVMGMTMLEDDADPESGNVSAYESEAETSYGGDHTTTWEADHDDDHEAGLQVQLQLTPGASHVGKSDALSDTGTNDDGFFAATFDFRASSNIEFSSVADESGFLSFEANDDWNPKSGDFQSFSHGDDGEMETYSVAKNEQESIQPNRYSTPSPSVTKRNYNDNAHEHESNIDFELEGPIDSDTLEQWDAKDPAAYCYNPTVSQATQGKGENNDTRSGRNTPELTASSNTSSNSMDDDGFGISSPIDVDTLQPWAPTRQLAWSKSGQASESSVSDDEAFHSISSKRNQSSHVSVSEAQDDFEDMWNDANSCSFDGRDFAETDNLSSAGPGPSHTHVHTPSALPEKAGREAISLTLGMLAQISGLADFDAVNTNKYGRSYKDDILEDEDAEAIAKAASQTQDHDKASPEGIENSTSAGFRCTSQALDTQFPTKSASPFAADVSKIENSGELSDENAAALLFNSPFEASVSRIENNSHDEVQLSPTDEVDYGGDSNEISDSFAGPRALEGAFQDVENEFDSDQAEKEMAHIVSQIKGTWEERAEDLEARLDVARKDKKKEGRIAEVQKYWKEKQQKLASIHTDSRNNVKSREVNVEWPDAQASAPLKAKRPTALEDDFLSRNKNTKEWDVPSSVFTSGNTDASHVTDLSSLCEQSMDLTDDGYPVFKRKTAKEAYRASNKSVHSSNSAKGFFWRSHPEGANVEVTPRTRSKTAEKKRIAGHYPPSAQKRPGSLKRSSSVNAGEANSEYINFPDSLTRRASRDEEDTKLKPTKASALERIKSMPTQVTSNASVPWGKENLKLRNVDLSRSKSVDNPQNRRDEPIKSSPTMEWRKAIEAKIKSTSDKVRAVRTNATSPTSFTEKKPPAAPSKPNLRRAPSPFQANRNSFLNKRPPTDANRSGSTQRESIIIAGVPRTIEKRTVDDDAISGCSSMADRIKQFETKTQSHDDGKPRDNGKHSTGMFNRTTPLNSYALNKLRNVTSNVGGLWS